MAGENGDHCMVCDRSTDKDSSAPAFITPQSSLINDGLKNSSKSKNKAMIHSIKLKLLGEIKLCYKLGTAYYVRSICLIIK